MSKLVRATTTSSRLFSIGTATTEIQIVATTFGLVIDLQADNIDTDGHARRCHATARLPADVAMQLEIAVQKANDVAWGVDDPITERSDPRQTALWSPATFTAPVWRAA